MTDQFIARQIPFRFCIFTPHNACTMKEFAIFHSPAIDLTLTLKPGMRGVAIQRAKTLEQDGWNASHLQLYSHCGTHVDAPYHFGVNDQRIDDYTPDAFMGKAWIAHLTPCRPRQLIGVSELGETADQLKPGDSLILHTGWSQFVDLPKYREELPRVSRELALWCIDKKVKILAVEPPSVADVNDIQEVTEIHRLLLGANIIIVEGLTNLEVIRTKWVWLMALPLKISRGDGAPARVIAFEGDFG